MDMTSLISAFSGYSTAKTAYQASVSTMKMALDQQETTGNSVLSLLSQSGVNRAVPGSEKGGTIDTIA